MNYQYIYDEFDRNLRFGRKYMLNKFINLLQGLSKSSDEDIKSFAIEKLGQTKDLKEPYNYHTVDITDYYSHERIVSISHEIMDLIQEKI